MSKVTVIPNQWFGQGDIHFCQTLVHRIANGNPIVWPCMPQFVDGLNKGFPSITFVDYRTFPIDYNIQKQYRFEHPTLGTCEVLPLRFAGEILKVPYNDTMRAKYDLYGMDWRDWRECAMWNPSAMMYQLYRDVFPVDTNDYTIVNRTFGSDSKLQVNIPMPDNGIELTNRKHYSLFDWAWLLKQASAIHTVNTSIIYLLEMLDLQAPEIHLYQRSIPGQTFDNISYLLEKHKYVLHP